MFPDALEGPATHVPEKGAEGSRGAKTEALLTTMLAERHQMQVDKPEYWLFAHEPQSDLAAH